MNLGIKNIGDLRTFVKADKAANPRDLKSQFLLAGFRTCQWLILDNEKPRLRSLPFVALYRIVSEVLFGVELRPKTLVGPGLTIYHGFGLVVNDHATIGANVTLRNGVVIGNKVAGGICPNIGDGVEVGANAIIIGGITIGANAKIGAGAVVLRDVEPGASAVGNPARIVGV